MPEIRWRPVRTRPRVLVLPCSVVEQSLPLVLVEKSLPVSLESRNCVATFVAELTHFFIVAGARVDVF